MSTLYTLVGLPGCGKSTYTQDKDAVVISTDAIREELLGDANNQEQGNVIFAIAFKRIQNALKNGQDVIFDATNLTRNVAVFIDTPKEVCIARQQQRDRVVPVDVIERMSKRLTVPTVEEGFDEVIKVSYK